MSEYFVSDNIWAVAGPQQSFYGRMSSQVSIFYAEYSNLCLSGQFRYFYWDCTKSTCSSIDMLNHFGNLLNLYHLAFILFKSYNICSKSNNLLVLVTRSTFLYRETEVLHS